MSSLLTSLQNFWKLGEASGNRADSFGSNTLTDTGTVGTNTGLVYPLAAEFDGAVELRNADATLQAGDTTFTIGLWFWPDTIPVATEGLIGKWDTLLKEYLVTVDASGNVVFLVSPEGITEVSVQCATQAAAASWNLVIVEHNATDDEIRAWLNNDAGANAAHSTGVFASTALFSIGRGDQTGNFVENRTRAGPGMFWRRALTAEERAKLWNGNGGLPLSAFDGRNQFATAVDVRDLAAVIWQAAGVL